MIGIVIGDTHDRLVAPIGVDPWPERVGVVHARGSDVHHLVAEHPRTEPGQVASVKTRCGRSITNADTVIVDGWGRWAGTKFCLSECGVVHSSASHSLAGMHAAGDTWTALHAGADQRSQLTVTDAVTLLRVGSNPRVENTDEMADWFGRALELVSQLCRELSAADPQLAYRRLIGVGLQWRLSDMVALGVTPGTDAASTLTNLAGLVGDWYLERDHPLSESLAFGSRTASLGIDPDAVEAHLDAMVEEISASSDWCAIETRTWSGVRRSQLIGFPWRADAIGPRRTRCVVAVPVNVLDRIMSPGELAVLGPVEDLDRFDERCDLFAQLSARSPNMRHDDRVAMWEATARLV